MIAKAAVMKTVCPYCKELVIGLRVNTGKCSDCSEGRINHYERIAKTLDLLRRDIINTGIDHQLDFDDVNSLFELANKIRGLQ